MSTVAYWNNANPACNADGDFTTYMSVFVVNHFGTWKSHGTMRRPQRHRASTKTSTLLKWQWKGRRRTLHAWMQTQRQKEKDSENTRRYTS